MSILQRVRDAVETRAVQRRADMAFARVSESIASQLNQELTEEDAGWRKLGEGAYSYDLTPTELREVRAKCLKAWQIDPSLGNATALLNSGAFGSAVATPRAQDSRVQDVINRLWDDEDNQIALLSLDAMERTSTAMMVDGERFVAVHASATESKVKLSEVPCSEIAEVITHPENARKALLYRRTYRPQVYDFQRGAYAPGTERTVYYADLRCWRYLLDQAFGEDDPDYDEDVAALIARAGIDAGGPVTLILHIRTNTLGLRGIPEIYRAYDWVRSHSRTLSDMVTLSKALAMFAWRKKLQTRSATAIENAAKAFQQPVPGTAAVHVSNERVELDPVSVGTGGVANLEAASRQTHLQGIRSFGFGEHWYSDASTGNLATASAMDMPAIWRIEARQALVGGACEAVTAFAIDMALLMMDYPARRLPQRVDTSFDLDFPQAQPRNENVLGIFLNALATSADSGLLDKREAAYQAYTALGSNNVQEILERQFPATDKLDGDAATIAPDAKPVTPDVTQGVAPEQPVDESPDEQMQDRAQEEIQRRARWTANLDAITDQRAQEAVSPFRSPAR